MNELVYHFASIDTGRFNGSRFTCNDPRDAEASARPGMVPVLGVTDWQRQRWDSAAQALVQCEPIDDPVAKRFDLIGHCRREIERLEARKIRPIGALLLDPSNAQERGYLAEIEEALASARAQLAQLNQPAPQT